ncbi:unnamed protein product [Symbiodinium necroappetens]|uniref:C3H1-type domain-containing protein n=1 Tax=Symbiodinium necroappetens TaxID=1628268 RepID=A0A812PH83_9DINO|nr:unnamed protein product [Symbiodinium necroappetens]
MRRAHLASQCLECQQQILPGDEIYPVEGRLGLKRSSLCWLHLPCAQRLGPPPVPLCKHFVRSGCCLYGEDCFFAHPPEAGQEALRRQRSRAQRPNTKIANRGEGRRNGVKNYSKASVLRRWLLDSFGVQCLRAGSGVLDVAGGKGELAWELVNLNLIPAVVLEPRLLELQSVERKWRNGIFWRNPIFHSHLHCAHDPSIEPCRPGHLRLIITPALVTWLSCLHGHWGEANDGLDSLGNLGNLSAFEHARERAQDLRWTRKGLQTHEEDDEAVGEHPAEMEDDAILEAGVTDGSKDSEAWAAHEEDLECGRLAAEAKESILNCSAVVALHPDQAAEPALRLALALRKPCAIVPCCVYSAEFPKRKLRSGRAVRTYEELLEYLQQLDERIQRVDLDFEGKRTLLFITPEDALREQPSATAPPSDESQEDIEEKALIVQERLLSVEYASACRPAACAGHCVILHRSETWLKKPLHRQQRMKQRRRCRRWWLQLGVLSKLAAEVQNCSSVQSCGLGKLFLFTGALTSPGYDLKATVDRVVFSYHSKLEEKVKSLQRKHILAVLHRHRSVLAKASALSESQIVLRSRDFTIGVHADQESASGAWRGQIRAWQAFAETQAHGFLLDQERHFTGAVFARFLDLYWASSSEKDGEFWLDYGYLIPQDTRRKVPSESFAWSRIDEVLQKKLVIFTQPPGYWDSLEALAQAVPKSPWTVWVDFDLTISPCCFDSFSFTQLIVRQSSGDLPHVVFRDSPREDYHHHCANAGFIVVRNTSVGRLFVELAREKRRWPRLPYGYQAAVAESLLELLGIETAVLRGGPPSYSSQCLPHLVLGKPLGDTSYANYCMCWRQQLDRLVGEGRDGSRWVQFLRPREGPEVGLLLASLFLYRGSLSRKKPRGAGYLPLHTWSRAKHRRYVEAWVPPEFKYGGPCALLPLILHWASLPHRPALIYDFLNSRFPKSMPLDILVNGTAHDLAIVYRAAAQEGRASWHSFLKRHANIADSWRMASQHDGPIHKKLDDAACNLGSWRLWLFGGYTDSTRSTDLA